MKRMQLVLLHSVFILLFSTGMNSASAKEPFQTLVQACTELNHQYAFARDQGDVAAYERIFSDDAEFIMQGKTYVGKPAILTRLTGGEVRYFARLLIGTVAITPLNEFSAQGVTYFTMFQAEEGDDGSQLPISSFTTFMGEYHDSYEFESGTCRLSRRETKPLFMGTAEAN